MENILEMVKAQSKYISFVTNKINNGQTNKENDCGGQQPKLEVLKETQAVVGSTPPFLGNYQVGNTADEREVSCDGRRPG